jgi:hypothetical protein
MDSHPFPKLPELSPCSQGLSMAAMLQLEPQPLRRLLKAGLRQGATEEQLAVIFLEGWGLEFQSDLAQSFLVSLEEHGWLQREGLRWKTRLGKPKGC